HSPRAPLSFPTRRLFRSRAGVFQPLAPGNGFLGGGRFASSHGSVTCHGHGASINHMKCRAVEIPPASRRRGPTTGFFPHSRISLDRKSTRLNSSHVKISY